MSTRDFFRNKKVVSSTNLEEQYTDVESTANAEAQIISKNRFIPQVDFASASNFAFFGSAEEYYTKAMTNIADRWPFDGSQKEQTQFLNSSSYIDLYVFDNLYPRTNGYIQISGENTHVGSPWGNPDVKSYITFTGSLHTASGGMSGKPLATTFTGSNIYEADIYTDAGVLALGRKGTRTSNLLFDLPSKGLTVEFWQQGRDAQSALRESLFDLWNGELSSSAQYGRLTLYASNSAGTTNPSIFLNVYSGTIGVHNLEILTDSTYDTSDWKHYAFALSSGSTGLTVESYLNGVLTTTTSNTLALNEVTGALRARIGSLLTNPSGASVGTDMAGYGKTTGVAYDEFRYWKAERTTEQIAKYYWTQVRGGTNTDLANTTLGVYFKFNEGITGTPSIDQEVLDYSGRISDGTIFNYGTSTTDNTTRFVGSAIVSASAATSEFKDPIIYKEHPSYITTYDNLQVSGTMHDDQNSAYLYRTLPGWITEQDEDEGDNNLKSLMQIMGNTFDTIYLQTQEYNRVQNVSYGITGSLAGAISGSKPFTHNSRILESYGFDTDEVLAEQTFLEYFSNRGISTEFDEDLTDVKNQIYRNIYNNLVYLYKSKGTEKSIRNLLRCIGLPRNVVNLNAYSNNNTYLIEDRYQDNTGKKKYINFYNTASFDATVFQSASSNANARSRDVVANTFGSDNASAGNSTAGAAFNPTTIEANIILPKLKELGNPGYFDMNFQTASVFTIASASNGVFTQAWPDDEPWLEVQVIRPDENSNDAYFKLVGIGYDNAFGADEQILTSSIFKNAYDNNEWTLALTISPSDQVRFMSSGSSAIPGQPTRLSNAETSPEPPIKATLIGYNTEGSYIKNSFEFTHAYEDSDSDTLGYGLAASPTRVSAGARRTNYSGSVLLQSNIKLGHLRRFNTKLSKEAIKNHAIDRNNFGTERPQRNQFLFADTSVGVQDAYIPDINSLEFNVDFQTVTGSDSSGEFTTVDYSSGSVVVSEDLRNNYPAVGAMYATQYEFLGTGFPTSETTTVVNTDLLLSSDLQLPEAVNSSDMISVLSRDDELFTRDPAVFNMNFALEKSYNQVISGQMVDFFGGIIAFNDLLGDVGNKYRSDYDQLEILRTLFFDKIENLTDFNQFYEFYKWIDDSIINFVRQLVPASANFENNVRNLVEQHILERNKVKYQYPYLDYKGNRRFTEPTFEATVQGVKQLVYDWKFGHAPVGSTDQLTNEIWWSQQAKSTDGNSSGNTTVDTQRQNINNQKTAVNTKKVVAFRGNTGTKYYRPIISRNGTVQTLILSADANDTTIQSGRNTEFNKNPNIIRALVNEYDPTEGTRANKRIRAASEHLVQGGAPTAGPGTELFVKFSNDDAPVDSVENYEPNLKRKLPRYLTDVSPIDNNSLVNVTDDFYATNIENVFIGTVRSSSVTTGYGAVLNESASLPGGAGGIPNPTFDITNIHLDTVFDNDIPMQGPFTEAHVGGYQYRHQNLNQGATLDIATSRAEGWKIANPHDSYDFVQQFQIVPGQCDDVAANSDSITRNPYAIYIRDEYAKRPLNIRNIKYTTGSQVFGNYQHDYDLVLLSGRYTNNHVFVYNDGFGTASIPSTFIIDGLTDYTKPDRFRASGTVLPTQYSPSTQHVLVQRFSAPGDVTTAGDNQGGPGLDYIAAEFAPNNSINFRNMTVRQPYNRTLLVDHMNYGGFWSDQSFAGTSIYNPSTITPTTYLGSASFGGIGAGTASLQKHNRNPRKVVNQTSSADFISNLTETKFVYDNAYISTNIPNSDTQYAWITASIDYHDNSPTRFLNYAPADGMVSTSAGLLPAFEFYPQITSASYLNSVANALSLQSTFVGMNTVITMPISASDFTIGYPLSMPVENYIIPEAATLSLPHYPYVNKFIINYAQGPWGASSFEQTRVGEKNLARYYRTHNLYTYSPEGGGFITVTDGTFSELIKNKFGPSEIFTQSPVTSRFKPASLILDTSASSGELSRNRIQAEHGNQNIYLSNDEHSNRLNLTNNAPTALDLLTTLYTSSPSAYQPKKLTYKEVIWPSAQNTYLSIVRQRTDFSNNFWKDTTSDRTTLGREQKNISAVRPAFGYARSSWDLDVYPGYSDLIFSDKNTTGNSSPSIASTGAYGNPGILQNYTTFNRYNTTFDVNANGILLNVQPTYNRPQLIQTLRSVASPFGMDIFNGVRNIRDVAPAEVSIPKGYRFEDSFLGSGQAKWQAGAQAGHYQAATSSDGSTTISFVTEPRNPFYNSYDEYASDIRVKAKDYSIIPEYRSSNFIDRSPTGDVIDLPEMLAIVQSTASGTPINSAQDSFYTVFANSDFMKYFTVVRDNNQGALENNDLILKCNAIKKFLPYNGFYPAERTSELVSQFFKTYSGSFGVSNTTTTGTTSDTNKFRPVLQTMFAPGVLYNTIKSGIAVDYPIFTGSYDTVGRLWASSSVGTNGFVALSSSFHTRIPFEAVYNPESYLNTTIVDNEPLARTRLGGASQGSSAGRLANDISMTPLDNLYVRMANNFLAETQKFFIQGSKPTTIFSAPEEDFNTVVPGKPYGMRIKMYRSMNRPHPNSGSHGDYPVPQHLTSSAIELPTAFIYLNDGITFNPGASADANWPDEVIFVLSSSVGKFTVSGSSDSYSQSTSYTAGGIHDFVILTGTNPTTNFAQGTAELLAATINLSQDSITSSYRATYVGTTTIANTDGFAAYSSEKSTYQTVKIEAISDSMENVSISVDNRYSPATPAGLGDNIDEFWFVSDNLLSIFPAAYKLSTGNMATGGGALTGSFATGSSLTPKETLTMYSRPTAFGPPICGVNLSSSVPAYSGAYDSGNGFNMPFTPPYYDGQAWMDVIFVPHGSSATGSDSGVVTNPGGYQPTLQDSFPPSQPNNVLFLFPDEFASTYGTRTDGIFVKHWNFDKEAGINPGTDLAARDGSLNNNAMSLSASIDAFRVATDSKGRRRWAIDLKYETPVLNFSHLTSSDEVFYPTGELSSSVPRGMWHQFGRIPREDEGIYIQVGPIPQNWLDNQPNGVIGTNATAGGLGSTGVGKAYEFLPSPDAASDQGVQPDGAGGETLDNICGFSTMPQKIGQLKKRKKVFEAVVAIPFVEEDGVRNFFKIPRDTVRAIQYLRQSGEVVAGVLSTELDAAFELVDESGSRLFSEFTDEQKNVLLNTSVADQIRKMEKYNFPPSFDFLKYFENDPISMYIFEFSHVFTEDDLSHMWQNLMPKVGIQMETAVSRISHPLITNELLGGDDGDNYLNGVFTGLPENLQWMVFKVKQKAALDYKKDIFPGSGVVFGAGFGETFNYNWPYDQFSLVELAQLEANVTMAPERFTTRLTTQGDPIIEQRGTINDPDPDS